MPEILQGRLKIATNDGVNDPLNPSYQIFHPQTDVSQIVDFDVGLVRRFNKIVENAINVIQRDDESKYVEIPDLDVGRLTVSNFITDSNTPIKGIMSNAVADQDNNNIKETYATKTELDEHNFTVQHIIDFVENVTSIMNNKIHAEGLDAYLPINGGTINGNVVINGKLTTRQIDCPPATKDRAGIVRVGSNIDATNGIISIFPATEEKYGAVKLYQTRGHAVDGAVSQGLLEIALHDLADICEGIYQKKSEPTEKAVKDEYGRRISEYYLTKEYDKIIQANKLNIAFGENETFKDFTFNVNNNSYAFSPVEVLRLKNEEDNETITICKFDNADASSFIYEQDLAEDDKFHTIIFDGTMYPKTNYDIYMSELQTCAHGYISTSEVIPLNRFRKRISFNINTENTENAEEPISSIKLFVSKGILYSTTGSVITDNWYALTDQEKEEFFLTFKNTTNVYVNENILNLDDVQVVAYTTNKYAHISGSFTGIANKQLILPRGLIPTGSFVTILNANILYTQHGLANVRVAVSEDLETWYTYKENFQEWIELPTEYDESIGRFKPQVEALSNSGILASRLLNINDWSPFKNGIAFSYLVTQENITDECNIDELSLTVTMRGSWAHYDKATYAYSNNHLIVRVYDPGDYKINYRKY